MARKDPIGNYNFEVRLLDSATLLVSAVGNLLGLDVSPAAGFSECRGLEGTWQLQEYPEGGLNGGVRRFPTRIAWSNISLLRGVGLSSGLWDWYFSYINGSGRRRDGLILLLNDRRESVMVWKFKRGLPVKWTGPTLSGRGNDVAIETLEIAHEGLEVQPGPGLFGPSGVSSGGLFG
jgi:phage tail-like protein